jgi:hypothetical protein
MRAHRLLVPRQSLEEVLHEPGCCLCRFLKDYQAIHLQEDSANEIRHLCNFHTWGLAAVQDAPTAADIFIRLLVNDAVPSPNAKPDCDVCRKVGAEEDLRIRELVTLLGKPQVQHWLRTEAVFCIPHGKKLRQKVSLVLAPRIDTIIENYREQLNDELLQLRNDPGPGRAGWGALGRAAEFLAAQRGLRT